MYIRLYPIIIFSYLNDLKRFQADNYLPVEQDILNSRQRTAGNIALHGSL
jgi:hypothetical protein